ncbi:NucA/NucB deoxyribonuclease domain-containing protein [Streptomyces sp. bgisy034]|uniref:NucA/NucB deoxyribonuclease domain-containing protein n=1 Tax=Streptomyces sp. bgisy034 TaxID=3413774 RepID=UPI003EB7F1F1
MLFTAAIVIVSLCALMATPSTAADTETRAARVAPVVPTLKVKVGVPHTELERLRNQGRSAEPGTPERRSQPQSARRTSPPPRVRGAALSAVKAEGAARKVAAADPQPTRSAADIRALAAAPIEEQPHANLARQCLAQGADRGIGRVYNRFTYCLRVPMQFDYWSVDARGVPVEHEGTTTAELEVFAQGDDRERRVRVFSRLLEDSVEYDWGPVDNLIVAPWVPLSLIAQCPQEDQGVCHATRGPATMPWEVWNNTAHWFYWDVYNHESTGVARDKISNNQWFVEAFTDNGEYHTYEPGRTEPRMLRCDSATYFNRGTANFPRACIFTEFTPHLTYELASDYRSVALHIFTAQHRANDTYPLLVPPGVPRPRDKRIPGRYVAGDPSAPGLHRITEKLHPAEYLANSQHKDGACYKKPPFGHLYLDTGLPVPPTTPDQQCDEYPFASTLEGAAHPYWDFSVLAVPQRDNSIAGGLLTRYYVDDRILAWDPSLDDKSNDRFYVHIS